MDGRLRRGGERRHGHPHPAHAAVGHTGFDLLMAIGVRSTDGAERWPRRVEALLAKHRFDTGCGIVRNGTPTNNTDSAVSGWRPPSTEAEQLFTIEDAPPDLSPRPGPLGETPTATACFACSD